ncbi:hypothetical protein ADEAN_000604600 [Angomonas deanei]|uniref:Uncharacterized protein n=1 Tax=Angomonas deanei TaxID=59799 RepID=A0A7G2CHL9_9TRYP|nr:hypothetical protein ADEAN_000604600 [Angomonas deanei]
MAEACAIRNEEDDKIHVITEQIRQLNERIWQTRFDITTVNTPGQSAKKKEQLARMMKERIDAVEQLRYTLTSEDFKEL